MPIQEKLHYAEPIWLTKWGLFPNSFIILLNTGFFYDGKISAYNKPWNANH
jgi:hypothetical protein